MQIWSNEPSAPWAYFFCHCSGANYCRPFWKHYFHFHSNKCCTMQIWNIYSLWLFYQVYWCCSVIKGIIWTAGFPAQHTSNFLDCPAWFSCYLCSIPWRNLDGNFSNSQQCTGKLVAAPVSSRDRNHIDLDTDFRFITQLSSVQAAGTQRARGKSKLMAPRNDACSSNWLFASHQDKGEGRSSVK